MEDKVSIEIATKWGCTYDFRVHQFIKEFPCDFSYAEKVTGLVNDLINSSIKPLFTFRNSPSITADASSQIDNTLYLVIYWYEKYNL
jgi:hypothetical protein